MKEYKVGRFNLFYIVLIFVSGLVIFLANNFTRETDAIIAVVEPQKIAISYQKSVKIKAIHTVPGQDINQGDLLLEVERPDLIYEIEKLENEISRIKIEINDRLRRYLAEIRVVENGKRQMIEKSDLEISELRARKQNTLQVLNNLQSFSPQEKQSFIQKDSSLVLEIEQAINSKNLQLKYFSLRYEEFQQEFISDTSSLNYQIHKLTRELQLLNNEAMELKKYAPCDGTIGNVYWQIDELVQPYETIISIYESNPTLIKAYMNVENKYEINLGQEVTVLAFDRKYSIRGNVVDIGSRIVNYPSRLLPAPNIDLWGQEIFIRIPENNEFLNGEKVFVKL